MSRTVGIPNISKYDEIQQRFLTTATGLRFYDEFLTQHGKHLFIFGTSGSGKTQKSYWAADFLKHLENIIWFDSGKTKEILPLLCLNRKVRIITPAGTDIVIEERAGGAWNKIPNHPEVIQVSSANAALNAIATGSRDPQSHNRILDTITIISFRNAFPFDKRHLAQSWIADFFERLAERCRDDTMPNIFPAAIFLDEAHWAIAGRRISSDGDRSRASDAITENTLDLRSKKIRLVLSTQSYLNIPCAARENMHFSLVCKGGMVSSDENGNISKWCNTAPWRKPPSPMQFLVNQGRFIFWNGDSYPKDKPWLFRLYPLDEDDRKWISGLRLGYIGKYNAGEESITDECMPELGRYSALAVPPEPEDQIINRWQAGIKNES